MIPLDIRTIFKILQVESDITNYACCLKCCAIYPPNLAKLDDPYPHHCSFKETDKSQCDTLLVKRRSVKDGQHIGYCAVRTFIYHSPQVWITELISRPGMQDVLCKAWDGGGSVAGSRCYDIMQAMGIHSFMSPDGKTPFSKQPDGSVHLVLGLFVNRFNPYGNKKAGKSHSIGVIYLVCMNLPPNI